MNLLNRYMAISVWITPFLFFIPEGSAGITFNLHALELGYPDKQSVDLSQFTKENSQLPGTYRVSVEVNGTHLPETQDITFVGGDDKKLVAQLTSAMLKSWGVNISAFPSLAQLPETQTFHDPGRFIPMASTDFIFNKLLLKVSIPQAALLQQAKDYIPPEKWDEGIPAAMLNYALSGAKTSASGNGANENYYANLQSGFNAGAWRVRNYSTWNYDNQKGSQWDSVNTWVQRNIVSLRSQFTLGESYTPSDIFGSVQFRGAQLTSDDNMLPDSLRGFAPVIRGIAQSNAQVTVRQNGYTIYQTYVAPGAFTLSDLYPTSASGDLNVTIKETDGSEHSFIQPFSAVPVMQREGRLKYAVTAGKYRSSNDADSSREPEFTQMTASYGLPHAITLYGGTLYSADYQSTAIGSGLGLGVVGSVSADLTVSHTVQENNKSLRGQSWRIQYAKDIQSTGTTFTLAGYRYSTKEFYSFQDANELSYSGDGDAKQQKLQMDISQSLSDFGSFFLSGYQQSYWNRSGYERTVSSGWNFSAQGINYSLNWSYSDSPESGNTSQQQIAFSMQVPLSRFLPDAWANYTLNTARHGDTRQQAGLSGTALDDNNLSYSVTQSYTNHNNGSSGSADARYKSAAGEFSAGYNYDDNSHQVNAGLSGGVVAWQQGIVLSQPLGESVALLSAPGAGNVKVQNNTGLYTDRRGYGVVPYVTPYHNNRIALDTSTLGDNVDIDNAVVNVIPTEGAVVLANFTSRTGKRALLTLSYNGGGVPFGATVRNRDGSEGIVAEDSQVYLTGLSEQGALEVSWNGKPQCHVHYTLPSRQTAPVIMFNEECR